jgi:hypothetical protein
MEARATSARNFTSYFILPHFLLKPCLPTDGGRDSARRPSSSI